MNRFPLRVRGPLPQKPQDLHEKTFIGQGHNRHEEVICLHDAMAKFNQERDILSGRDGDFCEPSEIKRSVATPTFVYGSLTL